MQTLSQLIAFLLRKGQQDLNDYLPSIRLGDQLTVQWPPGYGKSIGFALAWLYCFQQSIANRFLLIVANDLQRKQIVQDFASDCRQIGAPCPGGIWQFTRSASDIRAAWHGDAQIFVCTVNQLEANVRVGVNVLHDMLSAPGTSWMLGFDELQHYGEKLPWGEAAKTIMRMSQFTIAMSATPYRRGPEVIFAPPKLIVTYAKAVEEQAVKPMLAHSYEYRVQVAFGTNGKKQEYTTSQLLEEAPEGIDEWEERKQIRYDTGYLHPLIIYPLIRLRTKRAMTGRRLQCLIRAMSCLHAEAVCKQVRLFAEDLTVDWMGTGPKGRDPAINEKLRLQFCPKKDENGIRAEPTLDILIQVSMAGEGFDSINVSEIIDLFPVSKLALKGNAPRDKQFLGRGSRIVRGCPGLQLHVSFPSDHPLHVLAGQTLHEWMDATGEGISSPPTPSPIESGPIVFPPLPEDREVELLHITMEDEHFVNFAETAAKRRKYDLECEDDKKELFDLYLKLRRIVAQEESKQIQEFRIRDGINAIVGSLAYELAKRNGAATPEAIGKMKTWCNGRLKQHFGIGRNDKEMTLEILKRVYERCRSWYDDLVLKPYHAQQDGHEDL
jgi:hypothetical protein